MRKLIITLKVIAMLALAIVGLSDAWGRDYGHAVVALLAFVLLGRG